MKNLTKAAEVAERMERAKMANVKYVGITKKEYKELIKEFQAYVPNPEVTSIDKLANNIVTEGFIIEVNND